VNKTARKWFRIGINMILIDFELRMPAAFIEFKIKEDNYSQWTPNQDADLHEIMAHVGSETKPFNYDPHDPNAINTATFKAIEWVETKLGPPILLLSFWGFLARALMFWKYKLIWENWRVTGLVPRSKYYAVGIGNNEPENKDLLE